MTKILITGIAGFIGSNFARYITGRYHDYAIVGIDYLSPYSCLASIRDLLHQGRALFLQEDITQLERMLAIFREQRPDYVVNFAAESHNDRAILEPTRFALSNALGAQSLLEASRQVGVRRHLHVSTIEVYGEQPDSVDAFTEASPLNAKTPYSAAKAAGDLLVRAYMQTYPRLDVCLTHCGNNYGPYQFPEKLIPLAITNVLRGKKVPVYGDGLQRRDWLHVADHCRALDLVLHRQGKFALGPQAATRPEQLPIFDISARQCVTNRAILSLVLRALGKEPEEWLESVEDRPNHDRQYRINPAKIERELHFRPSIALNEGIQATVRWYAENEAWWRPILEQSSCLQIDWQSMQVAGIHAAANHPLWLTPLA
jgi:dTDP-glucose 4,6-dehydratase